MPLDVGGDVLEIVQRVCDRALNVATASAKSSTHGAKAGMRALRGRTVKHLPGGVNQHEAHPSFINHVASLLNE